MRKSFLFTVSVLISINSYSNPADSLEIALKNATGVLKVKTFNELFRVYINSDPVKAIGFTREGLTLAADIHDLKGMAACYNNLGISYRNQGALDKGLEYYLVSLHIYDSLKNIEGIATTKNNIGTIYSLKKDYGQAMKYFEESYEQFSKMDDKEKVIGSLNNLGNLHSDLQLYEQALKYYSKAWQLSEQIHKINSDPLNNIGNLYFRQGNYKRAVDYYTRSLDFAKKENDQTLVLNIFANLGEVYGKGNQTIKAQYYFDSAMTLCKDLHAYVYEPQILKNMASNFAKQGKMQEAYNLMVRYDKAKEKIYGEESSRKIAQMEIALDLQEKEKQVEELKKDSTIQSLELRNTRMVITLIVMAGIVALALFNLFWHRKRN